MLKDFPLFSFNQTHQAGIITPTNIVASAVPTNMKLNSLNALIIFLYASIKKQKQSTLIFWKQQERYIEMH